MQQLNEIMPGLTYDEKDDYYLVSYKKHLAKKMVTNPYVSSYLALEKSSEPETRFFKIKKASLEKKNITIHSPLLRKTLSKFFVTMCGLDFDLTLSKIHTYYNGNNESEHNLKGELLAKVIFASLIHQQNIYPFIVSNNYIEVIQTHLNAWHIDKLFYEIKGREDFHNQTLGDKEICFLQIYDKLMSSSALDDDGFIDLDAEGKIIDVVRMVLVDDDNRIDRFERFGIETIKVDPAEEAIDHLKQLNKKYIQPIIMPEEKDKNPDSIKHARRNIALGILQLLTNNSDIDEDQNECFDGEIVEFAYYTSEFYCDKLRKLIGDYSASEIAQEIIEVLTQFSGNDKTLFKEYINYQGSYGQTLLHFMIHTLDKDAIELLIKAGADINSKDVYGDSPFHLIFSMEGNEKISQPFLKFLISSGADLQNKYNGQEILAMITETFPTFILSDILNVVHTPGKTIEKDCEEEEPVKKKTKRDSQLARNFSSPIHQLQMDSQSQDPNEEEISFQLFK